MDLYRLLPEFTGPHMLPEDRMNHFRDNIRPNMQYCGLSFFPRLIAWCQHIKEYDQNMKVIRKNSSYVNSYNGSTVSSLIRSINDEDCYDSYYCNVPSLASTIHALMVAMSIITIIGLSSNIFCLIKMYLKLNRNFVKNCFGIYLSAIIIVDCLILVLISLLFIVPALSGNQAQEQLSIYQRYTFIIVPLLTPVMDLSFSVVAWIVVALLVQRSNITRAKLIKEADGFGFVNVSSAKDRQRTYCSLFAIVVTLLLFSVPKFAEYTFNYDITTGKGIVIPLLRIFKLYRIVYLKFLSPSVECMIPIIVMLAYISVIKYNEVLLNRHRFMRQLKVIDHKAEDQNQLVSNAQVLSVTGISRKTQLVIWISVFVLINQLMKLSAVYVELERNLEGSPREEWPRLRQMTKYLSISISIITVTVKPVIYIHCCPRFLKRSFSKHSKSNVTIDV